MLLWVVRSRGENPLVVAEKFIARENLHKTYLQQIVSFIIANSGGAAGAVSSGAAPSSAAAAATAAAGSSSSSSGDSVQKRFPVLECVSFVKANMEGLKKGLLEAQQKLKEQSNQVCCFCCCCCC